jgi:hypothetical protein
MIVRNAGVSIPRLSPRIARLLGVGLLIAAAGSPARAGGREEFSRRFQKSLPLAAGQKFSIDHSHGDVRVATHKDASVRIDATIRVSSSDRERAEKFSQDIRIEVESTAAGVSVKTVYPPKNWSFAGVGFASFSVDYEIVMPETSPLALRNRFGDVEIANLHAAGDVVNANGRVSFRAGAGRQRLENSFGAVELSGNAGDAAIVNSNGAVTATDVTGDLEVRNRFGRTGVTRAGKRCLIVSSNGDVSLDGAGSAQLTASFGKVDARNVSGDLAVQNSNGSVSATLVGGRAELATSFGAISFSELRKGASVTGSNSAISGRRVAEGVVVRTSFGGVELADVGGAVEVENSNGRIQVRDVKGGAKLTTRFGQIDVSGIGGDVVISGSNGAILLANVEGSADVRNSFGETSLTRVRKGAKVVSGNGRVILADVGGAAYVKTSFGQVEATRIDGGLTVDNSNGAVRATSVKGSATVRTSFAPVTLEAIGGAIDVDSQNGAVEVRGLTASEKDCARVQLKTSFAPIRLALDPQGGFQVTARTSFGRVSTELPLGGDAGAGGESVSGKSGDGRCEVLLTNSNGNIDIVKAAAR